MTEFPGSDLVPIEDGLAGVSVLQQTVGLVDDLVVHELPTHSTLHSEARRQFELAGQERKKGRFLFSLIFG
jgi:hypothetical protein